MAKEVTLSFTRSDGQVLGLDPTIWGVRALDGFDFPKVEIYTSAYASGIGEAITGMRTSGRVLDIGITRKIMADNGPARRALIKFFNSSYTFDLFCTYLGTEVALRNCYISASTLPTVNVYGFLELNIQLSSGSPYFENADGVIFKFSEIFPSIEFPVEFANELVEYAQGETLYFNSTKDGKKLTANSIFGKTVQNIDGTTLAPAPILGFSSPFNVLVNGVATQIASGETIYSIGSEKNLLNIVDLKADGWGGEPKNVGNGIRLYPSCGYGGTGVLCKATVEVGVQHTLSAFFWLSDTYSSDYVLDYPESGCTIEVSEWNSDYSSMIGIQYFHCGTSINLQFTCYKSKYIKVLFGHWTTAGYYLYSRVKVMLPQLEKGNTKTPYEMSALGAYACHDFILESGGNYDISKSITFKTFNGSESWVSIGDGKFTLSGNPALNLLFQKHGMSNRMLWGMSGYGYWDRTIYVSDAGLCTVTMRETEKSMTLAEFKAWLASNPVEVCYVSALTSTSAIPGPAKAALNGLRTKDLSTTVTTSCATGAKSEIGFLATYNSSADVKKLEFSELNYETSKVIENNGDYEKGAYFEIFAIGSFTNPAIKLSNKPSFRLFGTVAAGQTLKIDSENRTVFLDSQPVTSWIDSSGSFENLKLAVGANTVYYGADAGASNMLVTVSFNEFIGGI